MLNLLSDHDKGLYAKFRQYVPTGSPTIDLMFKEYFGSTFDAAPLKPLHIINDAWDTADFEFDDTELNRAWTAFTKMNRTFLETLSKKIYPKGDNSSLCVFRKDDVEDDDDIEETITAVNQLAREWCAAYNHFIRTTNAVTTGNPQQKLSGITGNFETGLEVKSTIHPLHADVHEDWLGDYCIDGYLPLVKLAMPKYRGAYQVIAWEKMKRNHLSVTTFYDMTLYLAEGNNEKARTYSSRDNLYKLSFTYSVLSGTDNAIYKILPNKLEVIREGSKIDDGKPKLYPTEDEVIIRSVTAVERNKLGALLPDYFPEDHPTKAVLLKDSINCDHTKRPYCLLSCMDFEGKMKAYGNRPKLVPCEYPFFCKIFRWEGRKQICIAQTINIRKKRDILEGNITLLLTSNPPQPENGIALCLTINVPDLQDEYTGWEDVLARPSVLHGENDLEDSAGYKFKVISCRFRDDLSDEELRLHQDYYHKIKCESMTDDTRSDVVLPPQKISPVDPVALKIDSIHQGVNCLVEDKERKDIRYTKRNRENRKNGGGKDKGDNRSGYDPVVVYQKIDQLKKKKTLKRACEDIVKSDSLNIKPESLAKAYRRYMGKP